MSTMTIKNYKKKSMEKRSTSTSHTGDFEAKTMRWIKRLAIDGGFKSMAELEARARLDDVFLVELDPELPDFNVDLTHILPDLPVPASTPAAPPLPMPCGTRRISIRVQERVLCAFKTQAAKTGVRYQTLMKRALEEAAERHL